MKTQILIAAGLACLAASAQSQAPAGQGQADMFWPKEIADGAVRLVVYQPQVDAWKKNRLELRAAATATRQGQSNEIYGIVTFSARTEVDKDVRMVGLEDLKVTNVSFPGSGSSQGELAGMLRDTFQKHIGSISLDRLLADVALTNAAFEAESTGAALKNDPPRIIFTTVPAVLILVDGEPVYHNVEGTTFRRVMNTPALLAYDPAASVFYLDGQTCWMTAAKLDGPWTTAASAPAGLNSLRAQLTAEEPEPSPDAAPAGPPPAVYVSTTPAELIETQGAPQFQAIPKTGLSYITNSASDIFTDAKRQNYYVVLAGRWYTARSLSGPWTWIAGQKLPHDFSQIPPDSPKSAALASVPGTVEAREAVIANEVPQTARVKRSDATLTMVYDGAPQFKPISGTSLQYAINTSTDVLLAEGRYYALQDGVWFVSGSATGPWAVADNIPAAVYSIPPSSPLYRVRFVYVFGYTPDYVEFGYTAGYLGAFIDNGVVVYGTGWWYPGWCGDMYFGWPWTWGFGFEFGYWTGGWFWHPAGTYWWYHNPPHMHRIYYGHRNPHLPPNHRERIHANANVYSRWPAGTVISRGLRQPPVQTASLGAAPRPDIYAGKDGHVYEHRPDGWYQRDNSRLPQRVKTLGNLDNQRQARSLGAARQREFQGTGHVSGMPHVSAPQMGGGGRPAGGAEAGTRAGGGGRK